MRIVLARLEALLTPERPTCPRCERNVRSVRDHTYCRSCRWTAAIVA